MKNLYARFLLWLLLPVFQLRAAQQERAAQLERAKQPTFKDLFELKHNKNE